MLLTVKKNQRRLVQQIVSQFRGHRHFPVVISHFEASHGRQVRWTLRARNATNTIREGWAGTSWIVELVSTGRRDGKPIHHVHFVITTLRVSPKALLRLVRQRWAIENQWHWPRDTQLGENAQRYENGFRSIRAGLMAVANDIRRMLDWVGISPTATG